MDHEAATRANASIAALLDIRVKKLGEQAFHSSADLRASMNGFGKKATVPAQYESTIRLLGFGQCAELRKERHPLVNPAL